MCRYRCERFCTWDGGWVGGRCRTQHEWNYGFIYLSYKLHFCYLVSERLDGDGRRVNERERERLVEKKNNLHLAIIRIIPNTKSISRVVNSPCDVGWGVGGEARGKKFRWWRSEGWKRNIITELFVVRRRRRRRWWEKTRTHVFTWTSPAQRQKKRQPREYISGFLLLWIGDVLGLEVGMSDGFCMWCGMEWFLWEPVGGYFRRRNVGDFWDWI